MKIIDEMILRSVYGVPLLTEKEISLVEKDLDVFVHQVRLERGKEPSHDEIVELRKKLAREALEGLRRKEFS